MAFVSIPDCFKLEVEYIVAGASAYNVLHIRTTVPEEAGMAEALTLIAADSLVPGLVTVMSNQCRVSTLTVTSLSSAAGQVAVRNVAIEDGTGLILSPALPNSIAMVVSHRSGLAGRSNRGRSYLTGLPEEYLTGNTWSTTATGAARTAFLAFSVGLQTDGYAHVILSRQRNKLPLPVPEMVPVVGYVVDTRVDTQRRRIPRGAL